MTRYIICEKCKELIEYNPIVRNEGGTSYSVLKCPKCGYEKTSNRSYIHYGEDGKR